MVVFTMDELKEYNGVWLIGSEVEFLEEMEKIIKNKIPCIENRDKRREEIAKRNEQMLAQQQARTSQPQSALAAQYQQVQAYEAQLDQQAQMSLEELENFYRSQYLATISPEYKAQIQKQLQYMIPSLGEDHPTVKQYKEMIDMDAEKANQKAISMAKFYSSYYKLRAINKEQSQDMNKAMYTPTTSLEELEGVINEYYDKALTSDYQTQLKATVDIGLKVCPDDLILSKLKPMVGLNKEQANQMVKQQAQQCYQNIQTIIQQDKAMQMQSQYNIQNIQQASTQGVTEQKIRIGDYLGFISHDNHIIGLNLNSQELITLPESICNLSHLKVLSLKWNKLEELPQSFGNLKALEELILDGTWSTNNDAPLYNELISFPDSFCELKNLKILKCEENGLRSLPDNFGQLTNLKEVFLYQNRLNKIPDSIGNLTNIKNLNLSSNKIESIPPSLCGCSKLEQLNLGFNSISKIPECIDQLNSLNGLYLGGNNITELPSSIFNLKSLQRLELSSNQLTEISEDIVKLKVSNLNLEKNQLKVLPYFIWEMESLNELLLKENPLSSEEQEVVKNDAQTIKDYCRQRASIAIMLIHTEVDAASHRIPELTTFLEGQSEVFAILPVDEFNLRATDLVLFLATAGSINSQECIQLLKIAKENSIEVVPLKGLDIDWGGLAGIGLSRELGHEFTPDDFNGFCENVYDYIKLLKRTHNIFKDKTALLSKEEEVAVIASSTFEAFKSELTHIIHSQSIKDCFNTYQSFLKPQYDNIINMKAKGITLFFSTFSQYFKVFMQQYKEGGQM